MPTSRKVNNKALSSNIMLDGGDIAPLEVLTVYVNSVSGNDNNSGSSSLPVKTFSKAVQIASSKIAKEVVIDLAVGTYTSASLKNILAGRVYIRGRTGVTMNGDIDLDDMNDKVVEIGGFTLNGGISGINRPPLSVRVYNMTINCTNGHAIELNDISQLHVSYNTITASMYPIRLNNCGNIAIKGNTLTGNYICIEITHIANANISNNTLSINQSISNSVAISLINSAYGYIVNNEGSLGTIPFLESKASIIFKGSNSVTTSGQDIKGRGGLIYNAA
ncbi:MAG: DUF1565 domain-containing protein [Tissierella sp.]|nr:DUF1565 domain-containing protein [Tissierella sp.]